MSADDSSATGSLAHSPARTRCGVVQRDIPREIPRTINAEVHVKRIPRIERHKQVLADRICVNNGVAVQQDAVPEAPLRRRDRNTFTREMPTKLCRDAVDGVALWHA